MSHILLVDRPTLSERLACGAGRAVPSPAEISARRRCTALLACCALAAGVVTAATPALAGCNSGNVANTLLLTSANCQADASGLGATAVGDSAIASGDLSVVVGNEAIAEGSSSVAIGHLATATGPDSTAIGTSTDGGSLKTGVTVVGAFAGDGGPGNYSTAIGGGKQSVTNPLASGNYSIAIGGGDGVNGNGAFADDTFGISIGTSAVAKGVRSTSIGAFAGASPVGANNNFNSAFGEEAGQKVNGQGNTATGLAAGITVTGDLNTATGNSAGVFVAGSDNTAEGVLAGNSVSGASNAAFGDRAGQHVTGSNNIAIGHGAGNKVHASNTIAIGTSATARQNGALALGSGAHAGVSVGQSNATAVGASAQADAASSSAFGVLSIASGNSSLALGSSATASTSNSVAIGSDSVANAANTVSVGRRHHERRIVNVATAVSGTDAVNLAQVQALIAAAPRVASLAPIGALPIGSAPKGPLAFGQQTSSPPKRTVPSSANMSSPSVVKGTSPQGKFASSATSEEQPLEPSTVVGWAHVDSAGSLTRSRNIVGNVRHGVGSYEIAFRQPALQHCIYHASLNTPGFVTVTPGPDANNLTVETRNHYDVLTDAAFYLMAVC